MYGGSGSTRCDYTRSRDPISRCKLSSFVILQLEIQKLSLQRDIGIIPGWRCERRALRLLYVWYFKPNRVKWRTRSQGSHGVQR